MALPEIAAFEDFLDNTLVRDEPPDEGPAELIQSSTASVHGQGITLWLAYPSSDLQLDSVLKKVEEALGAVGAPSSRSVALATLALIVETKGLAGHVEHANRLLRELRQGDLWFNFVSPGPAPTVDIRTNYGRVRVEPFDPTKLAYWADRGRAQWPIPPAEFRGKVSFVGRLQDVTLINTDQLPGIERLFRRRVDASRAFGLVDAYYQSVADVLLNQLYVDTSERMSLSEAAGIAGFDLSTLAKWSFGIHLFTWRGPNGTGCWAIFHRPGLTLNTPTAEIWESTREWLLQEFGIDSLSGRNRPIDVTAQTFAELMQSARVHLGDHRPREAFLYFVIALDHLLGEDGRNVSTVADRASVLTHQIRSNTFADEVAFVRHIYDARSRLVHSGTAVTDDDLRDADAIARGVLWALTRIVATDELQTRDEWVKKIDALAHLFRGDPQVVTKDRLAAVGALADFEAGPPPPLLRDRCALGD